MPQDAIQIAEQVGQEKPKKDITEVYDAEHGNYQGHNHPDGPQTEPPHAPKPFAVK